MHARTHSICGTFVVQGDARSTTTISCFITVTALSVASRDNMKDVVSGVADAKHLQYLKLFVRQNTLHYSTFQINLFCTISTEGEKSTLAKETH